MESLRQLSRFFCGQRMLRAMRARRTAVRFGDVTAGTDAYLPMIYFTSCLFFFVVHLLQFMTSLFVISRVM